MYFLFFLFINLFIYLMYLLHTKLKGLTEVHKDSMRAICDMCYGKNGARSVGFPPICPYSAGTQNP